MIPNEILKSVKKYFLENESKELIINQIHSVTGGSINLAFQIESSQGSYFLKYNDKSKYPKMFEREQQALNLLANSGTVRVPKVIQCEELTENSYLMLEWINSSLISENYWDTLARQLSELHKNRFEKFGFENENYIGSLRQRNNWEEDLAEFFWGQRIEPMLIKARNSGIADRGDIQSFDNLYYKLDKIVPQEKPSLIHGDLWKGNIMVDDQGNPCLIDPAVYYGHREMDIAMTQLFAGFDNQFYQSYNQYFKMEKDWDERLDLWNLYPLLVHANLFGESYMNEVRRNVRRFL